MARGLNKYKQEVWKERQTLSALRWIVLRIVFTIQVSSSYLYSYMYLLYIGVFVGNTIRYTATTGALNNTVHRSSKSLYPCNY